MPAGMTPVRPSPRPRSRLAAAALALALVLAACTGVSLRAPDVSRPAGRMPSSPAARAVAPRALCHEPLPPPIALPGTAVTASAVERIAGQVAEIRGLPLGGPVPAQ